MKTKAIQAKYERDLRQIGREVGRIINQFPPLDAAALPKLTAALNKYAKTIQPWAEATGAKMVADVEHQDKRAWREASKDLSIGIRTELANFSPIGRVVRSKLREQVDLITSLPIDAAKRVQKLTLEAMVDSRRSSEIAKEIMRSGEVTASRATLIARTEVGRTSTALTEARAESIGSTHFIWRTVGDSDVRKSHRRLEGKVFRWDSPPECDPGHHALPGAIWNCRCYPEPIIPKQLTQKRK